MFDSDVCVICNSAGNNWNHALIGCQMAKCVWAMMDEELVEHMVPITNDCG